jgi:hypothetical protein
MRIRTTLATLTFAALLAACSSGPAAPTGTAGSAPPGDQPTPSSQAQPTASSQPQPTGVSGSVPPFSFVIPSFVPDTTLEAAFPTEIDGQPVTEVESVNFLSFLQALETDPERITGFIAAMQGIGVDPGAVSFAGATVMVGEDSLSLQALRTPGGSAANALDALTALDPAEVPPTITTETIGGKPATVATLEDGEEEFFYANGDLAWLLPGADRAQAEVIFAALP